MSVIWEFIKQNSRTIISGLLVALLAAALLSIGKAAWRFFVKFFANRKKIKKEREIYKMYASLVDMELNRRKHKK